MSVSSVKSIRSLARGLDVLLHIEVHGASGLHDLHLSTSLPKSTLLRILRTLEEQGLVWRRNADSMYLPSYRLKAAARRSDATARVVQTASPVLVELTQRTGLAMHIAVLRGDHMEMRELHRPNAPPKDNRRVGRKINIPLSGLGRAYLAFCPDTERERLLERLRRSTSPGNAAARDAAWMKQVLDETRRKGYGVRDPSFGGHLNRPRREVDDGAAAIAVPIMQGDRVAACANLYWQARNASVEAIAKRYLRDLEAAAEQISKALGKYRGR